MDETVIHISPSRLRVLLEKEKNWDEAREKQLKYDELMGTRSSLTKEVLEKAKKWDEFQTELPGHNVVYNIASIREWKEKAKKWDSYTNNMTDSIIIEKAKKWDELIAVHGIPDWEKCKVVGKTWLDDVVERAEKWDEYYATDSEIVRRNHFKELQEKAKKWNEFINRVGLHPSQISRDGEVGNYRVIYQDKLKELEEKARKWDKCYATERDWFGIYKEKAKKYDEIKKILGNYEI